MGNLFYEEDVVFVQDIEGIDKHIWTPLANVIGRWRVLANSPDKKKRRQAIERYPILMAEISRFKTSLEEAIQYERGEEFHEYVKDCIEQVNQQRVTNVRILGSIRMSDE